ncbi:MAG: hypothetical protein JNN01_05330 [Opitutaceae bacterium]|nr:hypothetical protein [Opitutaceae bacterium]
MNRLGWCVFLVLAAVAPVRSTAAEVWKGAWRAALPGSEKPITLSLSQTTDGGISGTVEIDGQTLGVSGRIEGAWRELVWKDSAGCLTQFRGVASGSTWSGLTLAGGDGRLVDYGRVKVTRVRSP